MKKRDKLRNVRTMLLNNKTMAIITHNDFLFSVMAFTDLYIPKIKKIGATKYKLRSTPFPNLLCIRKIDIGTAGDNNARNIALPCGIKLSILPFYLILIEEFDSPGRVNYCPLIPSSSKKTSLPYVGLLTAFPLFQIAP